MDNTVPQKTCNKCQRTLPLTGEHWPKRERCATGFDTPCKKCNREKEKIRRSNPPIKEKNKLSCKEYYKDHPQNTTANSRFLKFGMTPQMYQNLLDKQNGVCAICHQPETAKINNRVKSLAVDHCHNTKIIRGLLCSKCNTAIGLMKENQQYLLNMINYLVAHSIPEDKSSI